MADALSGVNQMVSDLNKSLTRAIASVKERQAAGVSDGAGAAGVGAGAPRASGDVKEYEKTARKAASDNRMFATDIGVLSKGVSRLNVVSTLSANDTVDFYKFRVTTKGEAALGQVGDSGTRVQLLNRTGQVMADSDKAAGTAYDSFRDLQRGALTVDRGDYTLRVSRDKDASPKDAKNYALQLSMGAYSKDYDTVAKEARQGDSPFQLSESQQRMMSGLNATIDGLNSLRSGQGGAQSPIGSLNLTV